MRIEDIRSGLHGRRLEDVLLVGFVDPDEVPLRFVALPSDVYFQFDGVVLEFSTLGDTGRMRLSLVTAPRFRASLDEEDLRPAVTSIARQVLVETAGHDVLSRISLWAAFESGQSVECGAARLDLANGQRVFVDPSNYWGIRLGGREIEQAWLENIAGTPPQTELVLRADPAGKLAT